MIFLNNFIFAYPKSLYLLILLPLFLIIFIFRLRVRNRLLKLHIKSFCLDRVMMTISHKKQIYRYCILLSLILFLILALARPQYSKQKTQVKISGSEIMILADVSKSMLVKDMAGFSRFDIMKKELNKLISLFAGQRVGLISFSGSAVLVSPLTLDHSILKLFIKTLSAQSSIFQGTNFGSAFRKAGLALKRGSVVDPKTPFSKVIIVLSDGEDNEQQAVEMAQKLAQQKIRIFTLGFGSRQGGMIPIYDNQKNKIAYKKDRNGELVLSRFDSKLLKKIAHITKGAFYVSSFGSDVIKQLYFDIQTIGKGATFTQEKKRYKEGYQYCVFIALLLGFAYFLTGEKSKKKIQEWHNYLEQAK